MDAIEAKEMLDQIDCFSYTKMRKDSRKDYRRSLVRRANKFQEEKYVSSETAALLMGASLNGR